MTSILIFLGACSAIVLIGWTVSKFTGSRACFIDGWAFDEGEAPLWRDDRADVAIIPRLGQAVSMRIMRLHRWSVVVTDRRVLIGCKTLTGKRMVMYVLQLGSALDDGSRRIDGGLLTRGYTTLVVRRQVISGPDDAYVALRPVIEANSSANLAEIRIYTDEPGLADVLGPPAANGTARMINTSTP